MHQKDIIADWTSKKWHSRHNWHTGTGRFIKRIIYASERHNCGLDFKEMAF